MNVHTKLSIGRAIVRSKAPYFSSILYALIPVVTPGLRTMGVTADLRLFVNPEWVCQQTDEQVAALLVHEISHVVHNHVGRAANVPVHKRSMANIAMDLAINPRIRAAGWSLPPNGVYPEDFGFPEDLTFERYYELLDQEAEKRMPPTNGRGAENDGSASSKKTGNSSEDEEDSPSTEDGSGQEENSSEDKDSSPGKGPSSGMGSSAALPEGKQPGVGCGHCGGIAGNPLPGETKDQLDSEGNPVKGRGPHEVRRLANQALEALEHFIARQGRGSVPGNYETELTALRKKSVVRWQNKLASILKKTTGQLEAGGMDFSLARPSKRSYARGMPRPGLVQYVPEVAFILDTSVSMGPEQLTSALQECVGIFQVLGLSRTWLIQADVDVASMEKVGIRDLVGKVRIKGRGGTDFSNALKRAEKLRPKPDLIVYFTDGDGGVVHRPKGIEVVWCIVNSYRNARPPCDWGHAVIIANETTN